MRAYFLPLVACCMLRCAVAFGEQDTDVLKDAGAAILIPTESIAALGSWNDTEMKGNEIRMGFDWSTCSNATNKRSLLCATPGLAVIDEKVKWESEESIASSLLDEVEVGVSHHDLMAEARVIKKRRGPTPRNSVGYEARRS